MVRMCDVGQSCLTRLSGQEIHCRGQEGPITLESYRSVIWNHLPQMVRYIIGVRIIIQQSDQTRLYANMQPMRNVGEFPLPPAIDLQQLLFPVLRELVQPAPSVHFDLLCLFICLLYVYPMLGS